MSQKKQLRIMRWEKQRHAESVGENISSKGLFQSLGVVFRLPALERGSGAKGAGEF